MTYSQIFLRNRLMRLLPGYVVDVETTLPAGASEARLTFDLDIARVVLYLQDDPEQAYRDRVARWLDATIASLLQDFADFTKTAGQ